jgi:hypothetical protein
VLERRREEADASCVNTGPCTTDHEVLPSWSLRPRHSDMLSWQTRSENINLSRALFGCYNTRNYRVAFIWLIPNYSRWEWNVKFIIRCLP